MKKLHKKNEILVKNKILSFIYSSMFNTLYSNTQILYYLQVELHKRVIWKNLILHLENQKTHIWS
jgi:hypothetical protein